MTNIPLNKDGGIEPHLTYCHHCGEDTNELTLGVLYKVEYEGTTYYADRDSRRKTEKEQNLSRLVWIHVEENEKVPGDLCDTCKEENETFQKEVATGGVYFKCLECNQTGILKATSALATEVRKKHPAPDPIGIEFESCEQHNP